MSVNRFEEFETKHGAAAAQEVLYLICEAVWGGQANSVTIEDIHVHNACNHTATGQIEYAGETWRFIVESGDRDGTVIHAFGTEDEVGSYKPPDPPQYMFVPTNPNLKEENPAMYQVYLQWIQQTLFKEKLRDYHYDRYVQPSGFIEKHYRDWAAAKGLKIVRVQLLQEAEGVLIELRAGEPK